MDQSSPPIKMKSDNREVPSLQEGSLCYISRHVREFPVWHLASLPKHLRIYVLRFLPAVDICRLEEGPVCADIDMESEVWDAVCDTRLSSVPASILSELRQLKSAGVGEPFSLESLKVHYFEVLTCCLFSGNRSMSFAYCLLFHVPETQSSNTTCEGDVELLHILMDQCHFFPSLVNVTSHWYYSSLWSIQAFSVLAEFFSCLSRLSISAEPQDDGLICKYVFCFIIDAVFRETGRQPALTHLVVKFGGGFIVSALDHLALFASSSLTGRHERWDNPLVTGYSGLKFLSIELIDGDVELMNMNDLSKLSTDLRLIVEHQSSLESLHLSGLCLDQDAVCPEYDQLMQSIGMLFRGPQFAKLELLVGLYHSSGDHTITFKRLMHEFLSAPVKGQKLVLNIIVAELSLSNCTGVHECSANFPPDVIASKHLHIQVADGEWWLNHYFEWWLPHFPFQTLGAITLQEVDYLSDEALAAIASLNLHTLEVIDTELMFDVSLKAVAHLFSIPQLTTLTLARVATIGRNSDVWRTFAAAVTSGLRKQASITQLNTLDLSGNFLTFGGLTILETMFDALFSLPQLSSMILDLEDNYFTAAQLNLLCTSWGKKAGGRRLKMLRVRKQEHQQIRREPLNTVSVCLRNVAVTVL